MKYRFLRFPGGKAKAVTFSYDDGCHNDIKLAKIINRYGIKCTFNINSGLDRAQNGERKLTREEVLEYIVNAGHEIAVHGEMHQAPGQARAIDGIRDVLNCRLALEKEYGFIIRGMAYPDTGIRRWNNGANYETVRKYLQDLDIVYARTLGGDNNLFELPSDWYAWMPTAHHVNPDALKYAEEFVKMDVDKRYWSSRSARLYYLWGHSIEFEQNQNWDLLETLCECLAGHDDIWYATNIEIYDYITAYNSLVFSADGTMVYNPTLYDIWFDLDKKVYMIKSGERLIVEENTMKNF